jgi:hypothetical protein
MRARQRKKVLRIAESGGWFRLALFAMAMLVLTPDASGYVITNDGQSIDVDPITASVGAATYYNYGGSANGGDPAFGPEADTGFFWLYRQEGSTDLQLGMIFNVEGNEADRRLQMFFTNLPASGSHQVHVADDDSTELRYNSTFNRFGGSWYWSDYTDGGVIGDFDASPAEPWELHVRIGDPSGNTVNAYDWYFLSGENKKNAVPLSFFNGPGLDDDVQLTISIPEPATLALLAIGGAGILLQGRRSRRT